MPNTVTNIIKNLTTEQLIISACLICLGVSIFAGSYYKNKSTELEGKLLVAEKTLFIERDSKTIDDNTVLIQKLKKDNTKLAEELALLYVTLETRKDYMEGMRNVTTISAVCDKFSSLNYSICK